MTQDKKNDLQYKVLLLGNSNVGKTCISTRFRTGKFEENTNTTIGVDNWSKDMKYQGKFNEYNVKLNVWDTSGQERFRSLTQAYYKGAQGALIVYDITDSSSFEGLNQWIEKVEEYCAENA